MKNHDEKLRQDYEDAFFALVINELAKEEGEELYKENERLKNDPNFDVPEAITQRSLDTIRKAVARNKRQKTLYTVRRVLVTAACVAAIASLMVVTAYAVIPDFRIAAQNMLIQTSDLATRWELINGRETEPQGAAQEEPKILFGYKIPEAPEGFSIEGAWSGETSAWIEYVGEDGKVIKIGFNDVTHATEVDTEDANATKVKIHGYDGTLREKDTVAKVIWYDGETNMFVFVTGTNINSAVLLDLAEQIVRE